MSLLDLTTIDITILLVDLGFIIAFAIIYANHGNSFSKCRKIEMNDQQLVTWRFFLYATIFTTWIIAYMIFINQSLLRHVLHLFFVIGVHQMMEISLPAYFCKENGYGGTCNCDFYEYNDFYPMLGLGTAGNLAFTFLEMDRIEGIILFSGLILLSFTFYHFLPRKTLQPLKYPRELLINEIDQLQEFLMQNPHQRKLLVVLDAKCDFCEIQVEEIIAIEEEIQEGQIRVFDLTYIDQMDPIIPMTLNMNTYDNIPVPTTFIFDSGMAIEQKDGVLSRNEILSILM